MDIDPDKYVVFKRDELFQMLGMFLPTGDVDCAPIAQKMMHAVSGTELNDAVVIRRKDIFAGPALHAYAASISVAVHVMQDCPEREALRSIAHYFHEQALMADADSAQRLPD